MIPRIMHADEVPSILKPGMTVFVQGSANEPTAILEALQNNPEASKGVHYISVMLPGVNHFNFAGLHEQATMTSFFIISEIKKSFTQGKVKFIPLHFSEIFWYLENTVSIDVAIIQVSPPDQWGYCTSGVTSDFIPAILSKARTIVAEVNPEMPRTFGEAPIPLKRIDYIIETNHILPNIPTNTITPEMDRIGKYASTLIEDGDTLQFGIGSVPDAILNNLKGKRELGIHSGMITDALVDMVEAGVVTGSRKSIDRGKIITGMAVGTNRLYRFADHNPLLEFKPVSYTHSVDVMKRIDSFVSVNSAIEVDLFGQVNAETIGGVQFGGTGGQVDFIRGARVSRNGRSIVAMLSTAAKGKISRIVTQLKSGTIVTTARTDVQYIVTEYGIADLRNKSLKERAEALIKIAAPQFRSELEMAWHEYQSQWKE